MNSSLPEHTSRGLLFEPLWPVLLRLKSIRFKASELHSLDVRR
jgi:hypothetical protein